MIRYYLILFIQGYCLYHIYNNKKPYYWYFIVFFVPIVGPIIYFLINIYNKRDAEKIQNELTSIINPTKKVKDLERALEFSNSYTNQIALADAYIEIGDMPNAINNYKATLKDSDQNDLYARQQLVLSYFQLEDFIGVVEQAEKIKDRREFEGSKQQFCYGLALNELGKHDQAEAELKQIDRPYSNYHERLQLAKFYLDKGRLEEGRALLEELSSESQHMTKHNRRLYRNTINEVERLLKSL